ncbi:Auxin-induced protein 15A [Ananas comosus]|uniref:Auxin-induced protein 15A n=1 Tax=Ananas comosus TaxID=4615 RepID=A0A199UDS9_ANACO|nr:Auxin-induced protein 15A [Ananas comosus]
MGIKLQQLISRLHPAVIRSHSASAKADVPKGHFAVYVDGEHRKRFVVPTSYLKHPSTDDIELGGLLILHAKSDVSTYMADIINQQTVQKLRSTLDYHAKEMSNKNIPVIFVQRRQQVFKDTIINLTQKISNVSRAGEGTT